MKKWITLTALVFSFAVFAQEGKKNFQGKKHHDPMKMFEGINLTETQKEEVKTLFESNRPHKGERKRTAETTKKHQLNSQNAKPPRKQKEWTEEEKAKFQAKMEERRKEIDEKLQKILTPEQYKQFKSNMESKRKKFEAKRNTSNS